MQERVGTDTVSRPEAPISPVAAGGRTEMIEGDTADVRFRLTDEGSGTPLNALFPGAWMDVGQIGQTRDGSAAPLSCREKVGLYLKNIVGIRPMIDLNDYQLLVLNQEPTISVISPKIGVSGSTASRTSSSAKPIFSAVAD